MLFDPSLPPGPRTKKDEAHETTGPGSLPSVERMSKFEHLALVRTDLAAVHRSLADDAALPLMIQEARDEVYTSLYTLSVTNGVVEYRDYLSRRSSEKALTAIDDMQLAAASFEDLVNRFILAHTNVREQLKSIMSRTPSITSGFNPVDGELAVERAVQEVFLGHIVRIEQLLEPVAASFRQVIESLASVEKSHKSLAADLGMTGAT
ncbi:unnamed protein product [Zymoseptoria tritici ST99CH_3D1]|uniref:Uncharacterized protein n=1 Tax=Zymoseptoria tritici ST99CH_1E4 TaxID=1276532 RepID=A0A2H1FKM6_ZYMTR|nr:unnamed protein product [Zymoseptoria tritici ST99CH_1E4]SMR44065.1 unnamed protein product [Zymoseptoria tritici ST99CH_3D1]